jgi:anti-anti-sigma factor
LVVRIKGDASVSSVETLHKALGTLSVDPPRLVVLDLSELIFIASLGMGAILAFDKRVAHEGGHVRLAAIQGNVYDAFRRARLLQAFDVCESVEAALHAPLARPIPPDPTAAGQAAAIG